MIAARDAQAGLTMVEIMISLLLVSVAAAFVFSIQMRTSTALRDQQAIAEMQQTLRSASDQIVRDLRGAGYLARKVRVAKEGGSGVCTPDDANLFELNGVKVDNNSVAPDIVRLVSADSSVQAAVTSRPNDNETVVDSVDGFATGDTVLLVSTDNGAAPSTFGVGCVLRLTNVDSGTRTLQHTAGVAINLPNNCQCDALDTADQTKLMVTKVTMRAYRVSPSDARGILQMSPTGGINNDWVDMAVGIVDMQLALYVLDPGSGDLDLDGTPDRNWLSGDNMETALVDADNQLLTASVTLVAKTTKEVNGILLTQSPDVFEADAGASTNRVGDHAGTPLPVTDNTSMFYGDFVYRSYTSTVDLRNMGIGL